MRAELYICGMCIVHRCFSLWASHENQVPNPLFDLAGIMCGQFGVPFWEFFFATLIGKALVKTHIQANEIFIQSIKDDGLYDAIWQAFVVLLPGNTVGVQGDQRTYGRVVALRAITSQDGMTADWYYFEHKFLDDVARKICNNIRGVNRVVQDITSKPPETIEWE